MRNQKEEGLEAEEQEALLAGIRVFDPEEKIADLRKLRVTDLHTCKRITVPEVAEPAKEAKIQVLINGLEEAMHYGEVVMGDRTFRFANFASHFIRVQIFFR